MRTTMRGDWIFFVWNGQQISSSENMIGPLFQQRSQTSRNACEQFQSFNCPKLRTQRRAVRLWKWKFQRMDFYATWFAVLPAPYWRLVVENSPTMKCHMQLSTAFAPNTPLLRLHVV